MSLKPRVSFSSKVRSRRNLTRFLSSAGAQGFCMKERASGSTMRSVNFRFPQRISIRESSSARMRSPNSWSLSTNGLCSLRWSWIFSSSPSTVVSTPPSVPQSSSSSSSGISTRLVSLLKRSRLRSRSSRTSRVRTRACLPISLLVLVSAEWCPQASQVKLMMMKSEKQGTLVRQVSSLPGSKQTSQGTSKLTGSQVSRSDSSNGFTKFSLSPMNSPSSSCCSSDSIPLGLQPIASSSSFVRLKDRISMFLSILGAKGFLMFELPLGSRSRSVTGKRFPSAQNFSFSRKAASLASSAARAGSPSVLARSSWAWSRMDSMVVMAARLAGGSVSSSSSTSIVQCSDLMTSRLRSAGLRHRKRISTPQSGSRPANCTSLLLSPQCGQEKEQSMISRKSGMQANRMVVCPAFWQFGHSVSVTVAEQHSLYVPGSP